MTIIMAKIRDIGIDVAPPPREGRAGDPLDPFYGTLPVRGQLIVGQVVSTKMQNSCVVRREYFRYSPKYERYEKRTAKYAAHVPGSLDVKVGDIVRIMETRPISKTKKFVVVESRRGELRIKGMEPDAGAKPVKTAPSEPAGSAEAEEGGDQ